MTFIPLRLARWVNRHTRWDEISVARWAAEVGPAVFAGMIEGVERMDYQLVKFDPNTEPAERPIVLRQLHASDLKDLAP